MPKDTPCSCGCGDTIATCKCPASCSCRKPNGSCYRPANKQTQKQTQKESDMVKYSLEDMLKQARCWAGYEPVPGKKPYSDNSCRPVGSGKKKKKEEKKEKKASTPTQQSVANNSNSIISRLFPSYKQRVNIGVSAMNNLRGMPQKPPIFKLDSVKPDSVKPDSVKPGSVKAGSSPAWQRSEGKNEAGGLNEKGRKSYEREHGGNLKAPVTESKPTGERAKRQNSFCSRMCGMKRVNTGSKTKSDPDSRINKSLRKWNCKCSSAMEFGMLLGSEKQAWMGAALKGLVAGAKALPSAARMVGGAAAAGAKAAPAAAKAVAPAAQVATQGARAALPAALPAGASTSRALATGAAAAAQKAAPAATAAAKLTPQELAQMQALNSVGRGFSLPASQASTPVAARALQQNAATSAARQGARAVQPPMRPAPPPPPVPKPAVPTAPTHSPETMAASMWEGATGQGRRSMMGVAANADIPGIHNMPFGKLSPEMQRTVMQAMGYK